MLQMFGSAVVFWCVQMASAETAAKDFSLRSRDFNRAYVRFGRMRTLRQSKGLRPDSADIVEKAHNGPAVMRISEGNSAHPGDCAQLAATWRVKNALGRRSRPFWPTSVPRPGRAVVALNAPLKTCGELAKEANGLAPVPSKSLPATPICRAARSCPWGSPQGEMPSVPPGSPAVAPVAKPRCPPYRHAPTHRPSYRLRRATQIWALVRCALSPWNVAHRASGIAIQFAFSCVPPCAVEMISARCSGMVSSGLRVAFWNTSLCLRNGPWGVFPATPVALLRGSSRGSCPAHRREDSTL